ncbi:hypothetical protein [Rhizobium sp. BK379]|uniref:hypothetical protein n=1 Tax=Rhizobium sp. BK379 TaxID=2587059 RepID=UPI00160966E9|nr:hypothetical protein [Rhizobium sp. BK379]MBB3444237.1 hypothetical protein [Rhizobium sp. BK379]
MFLKRNVHLKKGEAEKAEFLRWLKKMRPDVMVPKISVVVWEDPRVKPKLPNGMRAVYSFHSAGRALKVGIAGGPNASARYNYQHYRCDPQSSTLANDVVKTMPDLNPENVADWIRENTIRIDFILPADTPDEITDALERQLIHKWDPKFEGRRR